MENLETFPLYLKVMRKKLRLDLMFDSDHIGLHERERPQGPGPWRRRTSSGVGKAANHGPPRLQGGCHMQITCAVFLLRGLVFIFILCIHSSTGFEWPAPNPIFLNSSHIFSVVTYFGFCFKSAMWCQSKSTCPSNSHTQAYPGLGPSAPSRVSSNMLEDACNFLVLYVIEKISNAKSS